jgi:hypothetical protein
VGWRLLGDLRWLQVGCGGRGDVCRRPQRLQGRAQLDELDDGCGGKGESSHQAERHESGRQHGEERRETEEPCVNPAHDAHRPVGAFLGVRESASTAAMVGVVVTMPRSCGTRSSPV